MWVLVAIGACHFEPPSPRVDTRAPGFVRVTIPAAGDTAPDYTLLVGETEITKAQWRDVMGEDVTEGRGPALAPVTFVSWYDAASFANALSEREGLEACYRLSDCADAAPYTRRSPGTWRSHAAGRQCGEVEIRGPGCEGYRLPTYREWRVFGPVAALAESRRDAERYAQLFDSPRRRTPSVVAIREPNERGLYDTIGNVEEWTESRVPERDEMDTTRRETGHGVWFLEAGTGFYTRWRRDIDPAHFHHELATWGRNDLGFRLVRRAPASTDAMPPESAPASGASGPAPKPAIW